MFPQSVSYATDPSVSRMVEETIAILNDVDTRLQVLKASIAQSVPHLAPLIFQRELASRLGAGVVSPYDRFGTLPHVAPFGSPFGSVLPGLPFPVPGVPPAIGVPGAGLLGLSPLASFANPAFAGVGSFRPW